jgi:LmbE family N-acetylglucosaminyl deacetylase
VDGLRPASLQDPSEVTVFSPHLDDAVLSAWHILSAAHAAKVVTVFAGIPAPAFVTDLDRHHGATESAARMRQRRSEDRAALALAGARPVHLDLIEAQFSAFAAADLRQRIAASPAEAVEILAGASGIGTQTDVILDAIRDHVGPQTTVYGPVGIGQHPDHRDLSRAMLRLRDKVRELHLFADSPYFVRQGLPSWIGGRANPAADRLVHQAFADLGAMHDSRSRRAVVLAPAEFDAKLRALRRYTTEFPTLNAHFGRAPARLEMARYEVFWEVRRA